MTSSLCAAGTTTFPPHPTLLQLQLQREIAWLTAKHEDARAHSSNQAADTYLALLTTKRHMLNNLPHPL